MSRLNRDQDETETESPKMLLRFLENGELQTETRMGNVRQMKQGHWEMISFETASATMVISCNLQMQETEHQILFIDTDTIELTPPNMAGLKTKIKFKRQ